MKPLLYFSLFLNLLLLGAAGFALHRLGGWHYAMLRLQHQTTGLYHHRAQHFERLGERPGSIIFLGDSQTEQAEWHELFGDGPKVLNRGISGDFTTGVLERLPEVLRHKPLKIFLLVGVNDLIFRNSVPEIETTYRAIVQKIRANSPDTELYLQSVLPLNNDVRKTGATNAKVLELNARIVQIARDFALPYLDIATPLKDADGNLSAKFTEDGLHLNGLGYFVWKKEVEKMVQVGQCQVPSSK
ncbi:MAG: GDSL-type esterase/lipase family protein [Saprospiraceae bacterium]